MSSATHNILVVVKQSGLDQVNNSLSQYNKTAGTATQNTDKLGGAMGKTGKSATVLDGGLQNYDKSAKKASSSTDTLGKSTEGTAKKTDGLAAKFQRNKGMIFGLTMLSSGVIEAAGMFSMYNDAANKVSTAQDELNKVVEGGVKGTESYQKALEKRNAAQLRVNDLVERGKQGTPAYTKAVRELDKANADLNKITEGGIEGTKEYQKASDELADAQKGLRFVQRNMILSMTDLIPMTLLAVSGFLNLKEQIAEARAAKLAATGATEGLTKSMKALRIAMVAIPLVAIATALLAIKTNAFGFRDALDSLGVKIGQLVPALKPLLQWIRDFATALGLAEKGMDLSKAWDLLVTGFQEALKKLQTTDWKKVFDNILKGISKFIEEFDWDSAWKSFKDALVSSNTWINEKIGQLGGWIIQKIKEEGPKWWAGFQEALGSTAQWVGKGIALLGAGILKTIQTEGPKWWAGFQEALGSTAQWVGTGIQRIGEGIIKTITTEGPKWWAGFQEALGSTAQWVGKGIKLIGEGITKTITPANAVKWWKGFQDALGSTAQWVGTGIKRIGEGIAKTITTDGPKWWKGFQDALGSTAQWLNTGLKRIADGITKYNWASVGQQIWNAIIGGFGSLADAIMGKNNGDKKKDPGLDGIPGASTLNQNGKFFGQSGNAVAGFQNVAQQMQGQKGVSMFQPMIDGLMKLAGQLTITQKAFSTFSSSVATYANSMKTNLGAFFTAVGSAIGLLDPALKTHQGTWSAFSTSILAYATSMKANLGTFFTTIAQALMLLDQGVKLHQVTWSSFSTSLLAYSTSMTANLGTFFTTIAQALGLLDQGVKLHQATWSAFSTSMATYATSMTTNLGKFFTTIGQALGLLDQGVKLHQKTWSTLSTSIATYSNSMKTNISNFAKTSGTSLGTTGKAATALQKSLSDLSKNTATYAKSMTGNLKSFSSSAVSSLNAVAKAAKAAESALKSMAQAAAKAKAARSGLRFGGAFVTGSSTMNQSSFAQQGKSWINSRPRKIGGVNISEFSKPELVTVTPLSNPSDPMDKGLNYLDGLPAPKIKMPDMSNISGGGGSSRNLGQPIELVLHTTVAMPDGKVLAKAVNTHLFDGFSGVT